MDVMQCRMFFRRHKTINSCPALFNGTNKHIQHGDTDLLASIDKSLYCLGI